ncbi:DUF3667 domain-containing protein [Microbulbifer sp. SH-1]|uniref:DUF3667 domain-containing protein n=1 Tax=Microbulbifer sp. SH-1 TaxID=2681547 RepID=UPI001409707B|nr:DUF3667 domain-containing protein [Microbulbifer sp. SH-1]QIL91130.1 DUF3667 domain-containing protein [Microbulbifer sp. SH-1]
MSEIASPIKPDLAAGPRSQTEPAQAIRDIPSAAPNAARCGNCAEPLLGPHCYACGQPEKSLVRQFPELLGDFFGTVFGLDSRIARTFGPLLLNPGFLTNEYFAGRRVRYVSPVRLFVFLCLTAFFAAKLSSDWKTTFNFNDSTTSQAMAESNLDQMEHSIATATSVEEVLRQRDLALAEIAEVARESSDVPGISGLMNGVEQIVRKHANQRIAQLDPTALQHLAEEGQVEIQPLQIDGAPSAVNAWFVRQSARLTLNISRIEKDPNLLKDALFGAIPSALFVMLPFFALSLGVLYVFKRRLYMEHLIVALHSHAFLSLSLLLAVLLFDLRAWLSEPHTLPHALFNLALLALALWVPVYLLLMQKRVYRQGWPMTAMKFFVLGVVYIALLSSAAAIAGLASVASF